MISFGVEVEGPLAAKKRGCGVISWRRQGCHQHYVNSQSIRVAKNYGSSRRGAKTAEDGIMEWLTYKYNLSKVFEMGTTNLSLIPLLSAEQS